MTIETLLTVLFTFPDDALRQRWLNWLREDHVHHVLEDGPDEGPTRAAIVVLDKDEYRPGFRCEVRYSFTLLNAFTKYKALHADVRMAAVKKQLEWIFGTEDVPEGTYRRSVHEIETFP